jgi:light-regulated signal transduction histidine kinase (bacteriophytochrome)
LSPEAQEYIRYAIDGGLRMRNLIECLLDFSRVGRQTMNMEPLSMNDILKDAKDNLRITIAESEAEITSGDLPVVMGDKGTLTRVIQNLIGNSIKFHGDEPIHIKIDTKTVGKEVEISITDNGIGIDPKHERKIFLIFQQLHAKSKYPGSGIGLSICKKIIERHGGKIWLSDHTESGAKFCFTLKRVTKTHEHRRKYS